MRSALAAALALALLVAAAAPHEHAGATGTERCLACVVHHADAARPAVPVPASPPAVEGEPARAPGLPPVCGAPLGAIPGQSPPRAA
jgi:hypothetical protein